MSSTPKHNASASFIICINYLRPTFHLALSCALFMSLIGEEMKEMTVREAEIHTE